MKSAQLAFAVLLLAGLTAGCKMEGHQPMPDTMLSEGVILKTAEYPIGGGYVVEERDLLVSECWNDVFPFNVATAKPAARLVKRLYTVAQLRKELIGWAALEDGGGWRSKHVSPNGRRIIYDQPEVTVLDGEYPRAQQRGVRPQTVAVYSHDVGRPILLDGLSGVNSISRSDLWRKGSDLAAFTSYCEMEDCEAWGLSVVSYGGRVVLDNRLVPELQNLEFIEWSPNGQRLAALRPYQPRMEGQGGGQLVEIELADGSVREVDEISPEQAVENLGRFDRLVSWSDNHVQPLSGRGPGF